jgi:hypothetical protein
LTSATNRIAGPTLIRRPSLDSLDSVPSRALFSMATRMDVSSSEVRPSIASLRDMYAWVHKRIHRSYALSLTFLLFRPHGDTMFHPAGRPFCDYNMGYSPTMWPNPQDLPNAQVSFKPNLLVTSPFLPSCPSDVWPVTSRIPHLIFSYRIKYAPARAAELISPSPSSYRVARYPRWAPDG